MASRSEFVQLFEDLSSDGMLSLDLDPPANAVILVDQEAGGKVWVSANSGGWLHLARICAELGLGKYEPGYHFHRSLQFGEGNETGPEISFEVRGEDEPSAEQDVAADRGNGD